MKKQRGDGFLIASRDSHQAWNEFEPVFERTKIYKRVRGDGDSGTGEGDGGVLSVSVAERGGNSMYQNRRTTGSGGEEDVGCSHVVFRCPLGGDQIERGVGRH